MVVNVKSQKLTFFDLQLGAGFTVANATREITGIGEFQVLDHESLPAVFFFDFIPVQKHSIRHNDLVCC
jgi:hypothetical protein